MRFLKCWNREIVLVLIVALSLTSVSCSRLKGATYHKKGSRAHDRGDFDQAITMYQKSIAASPTNPEVEYDLGVAYLDNQNYTKADQQIQKLKKMDQGAMVSALKELSSKGKNR